MLRCLVSVSADDTLIVQKRDYPDLVMYVKVGDACDVVLDAVSGARRKSDGSYAKISVDETIMSFSAAGEQCVKLSEVLATEEWVLSFPFLHLRFTAATTIDFVAFPAVTTIEALAKLKRWGRGVEPAWIHGDEITAPAAGTALVSVTVSAGKTGYIYGFFISAGEANDFKINWTSGGAAKSIRIPFSGSGALQYVDFVALNEGMGADAGTDITITNVNAGGTNTVYQARLLYAEV